MSESIHPKASSHHTLDRDAKDEQHTASAQAAPSSVEPVAPQDAQAQGANQDEKHALLQGNVSGSKQKGAAEQAAEIHGAQPAGLHSTGRWSGTTHKQ